MTVEETYHINPDWGTLAQPILSYFEHRNGIGGTLLRRLQDLALAQFQAAEVPGRKTEDWKYTPLRQLIQTEYGTGPSEIPGVRVPEAYHIPGTLTLVLVNGHFIDSLSDPMPDGVWAGPVYEAFRDQDTQGPEKLVTQLERTRMTPFEALVTGVSSHGQALVIAPDTQITQPLHLIQITDASAGVMQHLAYKVICLGKHARADVIESFISAGTDQQALTNSVTHCYVEQGATLMQYRMQAENLQSNHINMTRIFQERDSHYEIVSAELGSRLTRNNIEVTHLGANITSNLFGTFIGSGRQHLDTQSFIDHAQPHCASNELYKGVLSDHARGVFNGKIIVRQDAQKTNAFQQNSTLVLSPHAIMDSKPQLEIFADDVRCSHGATIGQLDEDAVFYLRSRGLNKAEASEMLQQAFIGEVLDKCTHPEIRNYFDDQIARKQNG